ncbi:MAG: aspartate kinase [Clostridiales Family XIII bacterium]|jgi:aspartate kinase|nr:aspartate kinase [Clostridiales Family XIII bacterium]
MKSEIKTAKFGGSSVADAIQIQKIKHIITSDPSRKYIVVSAPGERFKGDNKITDLLYLCKTHIDHNVPYDQIFQVICDRYTAMEAGLGVNTGLAGRFDEIRARLQSGATSDYIASRGEYLNAVIIAAYIGFDFVDAEGIVLFDQKGKFLFEDTNEALRAELAKHKRAVLPGFYGSKPNGEIKTFSRGGADISGAVVARASGAAVYENWTDVSGFLMADPRIVHNPKAIGAISYKELRELSYMGASVLHESAIYPARLANIPINIRNTNAPEEPGTRIIAETVEENGSIITGIAGNRDFTVINVYKNMMSSELGFIRRLLSILENYGIPVEHVPSGVDTVSVVVANAYLNDKLGDVLEDFERRIQPDSIEVFENMSLIATVGGRMASRPGVSAKLFAALYGAGVNIRMIDQGSSEMNIIVGVENRDFETAIRAIYEAFVGGGEPEKSADSPVLAD